MARTPGELHSRAVELTIHGKYARALRALDEAAARVEDPDLDARILGTRAVILQRTGRPAEAEELCRRAMAMPGISAHTEAVLNGQLGALAVYGGRLDDAVRLLTASIVRLEDDSVAAARTRVNRSLVSLQLGRLEDATADLEAAITTFHAHGLPTDEGQARHNLGYVALLAGDLVAALHEMLAARPFAASSPVAAAVGDVDRAEVLRDAGLTTEAERILTRAATVFGSHRMPQSRAEAEFNLARSKLMHDPVAAGRLAAAAGRRFRALGNETWAARSDAVRLRALLSGGGPAKVGERVPEPRRTPTAAEVELVASDLEARGFRSEAAALRMSRELWRARHAHDGPARLLRPPPTASMDVRLLAHEVRAARASARGRDGEARRHAAAGLETLGRWQRDFGSLDLQTSIGMHGNGLIFAGLAAAVRSRRPDVLFEWSERARHLSQQVVPVRPPPDPELAEDLAQLRMLRADDPTGAWLTDPRAAELQHRARERQWSATSSVTFEDHVGLDRLRAGLDEDTALIAYIFSGSALTALVVTRSREAVIDVTQWPAVRQALPGLRADLDMSATVRTGPLADVVRRSLDDRLARLSSALLDEAVAVAGDRRLVITVPGILNGVPWGMLPAMHGRTFTLAVSATAWLSRRETARVAPTTVGLAVGPRVARGDEEVTAAASAWTTARLLRGSEATVDAVTTLAAEVDLLHIAAHGRHAADNALFSGLELADGALFGYDMDRMPQVPSVVVLSACEVGRSSVRWGEEAVGMTRVWLHAGTRAVIATPVIVADDVACELLGAMHEGLAVGLPPAAALAAASALTGLVSPFQTHGAGF